MQPPRHLLEAARRYWRRWFYRGRHHARPLARRFRRVSTAARASGGWRGLRPAVIMAMLFIAVAALSGSVERSHPGAVTAPRGGTLAGAPSPGPTGELAERAQGLDATSRSASRTPPPDAEDPATTAEAADAAQGDGAAGQTPAPTPTGGPPPGVPRYGTPPVAGLTQRQMDHAATIVAVGQRAGMPKEAWVIAVATALQESNLLNLANPAWPESFEHPHDGTGYDHDSVGLFQQRASTGWGPVAQLMDPEYAAGKFYEALARVPGWQDMPLTLAAQSVQKSAFPYAYARHEARARQIVEALTS
ncbi:MAG: hypothetical protein FWJ87_08100 [Micromonosporaceae bacterium]